MATECPITKGSHCVCVDDGELCHWCGTKVVLPCPKMVIVQPEVSQVSPEVKHNFLGAPAIFRLAQECHFIEEALGDTCYLVGSVLKRPDFRDVDVRVIFDDAKYDALFGADTHQDSSAFWSLLCTSTSDSLQLRTGLNIDFQVQKRSQITEAMWAQWREPLGVYHSAGKYVPEWHRLRKYYREREVTGASVVTSGDEAK